jgi:hypothetical protein
MTFLHTRGTEVTGRNVEIRSMGEVNDSRRNGYVLTIHRGRMTTYLHECKPKRYWIQEDNVGDGKINTDPTNTPIYISVLAYVRIIILYN